MAARKIFVVGGTGAQGIPVIKGLVKDGAYAVRVLTRNVESTRAKQLVEMNPSAVELVTGSFASEDDLRAGLKGCWGAFINIDGFNAGEKTEVYWTIRAFEIAAEQGVQFFVHGNLDYALKKGGYDPQFHAGHYDGKGRVAEWILHQAKSSGGRIAAAAFTTGPYIEMAVSGGTVMTPTVEDGVATWRVPLGDGAVGHVALDDCEYYVRWLFDNHERAAGMDLEVAIAHMPYAELAAAFERVTGHPARYVDTPLDEYWATGWNKRLAELSAGYNSDLADPAAMTFRQNFTAFWNIWRHSGGNTGVIRRDYKLLDEIHPNRVKSAEEWFRREDEKGRAAGLGSLWDRIQPENLKAVLKIGEDGRQGRL